jgi:hypothetical protein
LKGKTLGIDKKFHKDKSIFLLDEPFHSPWFKLAFQGKKVDEIIGDIF